jgi:hypothetical protein
MGKFKNYYPDTLGSSVSVETLAANTTKQTDIPTTANAVQIHNPSSSPIFVKLDEVWAGVPAGGVYVAGFMVPPNQSIVRKFSVSPIGSGHTMNMICASACTPAVEFVLLS